MSRYALVVGISEYRSAELDRLSKAEGDAEAIAQVLKHYGQVTIEPTVLAGNVTTQKLAEALETLSKQAAGQEAIIYFTGHAISVTEALGSAQGYLATTNCSVSKQRGVVTGQQGAISFANLSTFVQSARFSSLAMLIDTCHSGDFIERTTYRQSFAAAQKREDCMILAACHAVGGAFAKRSDDHSLFTNAVLEALSPNRADEKGAITSGRLCDAVSSILEGSRQESFQYGKGRTLKIIQYPPEELVAANVKTADAVISPASDELVLSPPPGILQWNDSYQPPSDIQSGGVLIGQLPKLHMLRRGYFCPRPVFKELTDKVDSIIRAMPSQGEAKLPIFWIGGRSGTGKSIALLYVLSQLFERGYDGILWVGHGDEIKNLPAAVSYAQELGRVCNRQVIIGIDDPHIPAAQGESNQYWQQTLDILQKPMQEFEPEKIPVIICCGPTEHKERFQRDSVRADQIDLHLESLPQASGEDYEVLCDYYRRRMGKEPPNVGDSNMLLTQLFFEWRSGVQLTDFAKRFSQRIQISDFSDEKDLYNLLSEILSLNRLYTAYSVEAAEKRLSKMSPEAMMAFETLLEENHLQILNEEGNRRGSGYFMQHPHIANAIYEVWHPEKPARKRQKHLRVAIEDTFRHGRSEQICLAPIWSLSNALEPDSPMTSRLDNSIIRNLIAPLFRTYQHKKPMTWNSWCVWVDLYIRCRALHPNKKLHENPIPLAIKKIHDVTTNANDIVNLCYKFIQLFDSLEKLEQTTIIESLLKQLESNYQWQDWPLLWNKLRKLTSIKNTYEASNKQEKQLVKEIVEIGFSWAEDANNYDHYYWQQVWAGLPKFNKSRRLTNRLFRLTKAWLSKTPNHHSWRAIWDNCRRANCENTNVPWMQAGLFEVGIDWLNYMIQHSPQNSSWNHVWQIIFQHHVDKQLLIEMLERYLQCVDTQQITQNSWGWSVNRIMQYYEDYSLEEFHAKMSGFIPKMREWLIRSPNEPFLWPHMWHAVHQNHPNDDYIISMGKTWLSNVTPEYRAVRRVWAPLFERSDPNDAVMTAIGKRLLATFTKFYQDKPRHSWAIIWSDLWDAMEQSCEQPTTFRVELIENGKSWLEEAAEIDTEIINIWNEEEQKSWQIIWSRIETACPADEINHLQQHWVSIDS